MVLIPNCSVKNELNRNPNPALKPWAFATRAVVKLLWWGGNQVALTLDSMITQGSPTKPIRMCPTCISHIQVWALGTNGMNIQMPHPTASIQAEPTPTMRSPKQFRNHASGMVKISNSIEAYSEEKNNDIVQANIAPIES